MANSIMDHIGRHIAVPDSPKRILSICPAITETLFSLGLDEMIVGRTKYCIFPKGKVENIPIVGGTKEVKIETIRNLQPDLILAEKEENTRDIVLALEEIAPVFVTEVQSTDDAYRLIKTLGALTNRKKQAHELLTSCQNVFPTPTEDQTLKAAYIIWRKPYMAVGGTTYINDVLRILGFENPFTNKKSRYPEVTNEELAEANLDILLLASEPFPFQEKHIAEFRKFLPKVKILLVDGEMFWYGAKMLEASEYLKDVKRRAISERD
ncbi:ABC transporter substrate-binding protein [Rummeliibacillus sp. BSL5]